MTSYLGYDESRLKEIGGYWTAKEISQQPQSWSSTCDYLVANVEEIRNFLRPIIERKDCRIILTGAGTSAFAGSSIAPALSRKLGRRVEAIPTTDLVSGPEFYLRQDIPTLLVSFARSGDSPESIGAVELANSIVDESYQLILSCNAEGELYQKFNNDENCLAVLMPEETNDRAFAMTSSFSSMLTAAIAIFSGIDDYVTTANSVAATVRKFIENENERIKQIANANNARVIFLGSNGMAGLAAEASLKLLELTDGAVPTMSESPLSFRHGPKSFLNEDSLIVMFLSADSYTRKYDLDMLNELVAENRASKIVALSVAVNLEHDASEILTIPDSEDFTDLEMLFPFVAFAQMYALHRAIKMGNSPDNPCSSGTVNRIVKGVKIHAR